MKIEIKSDKKKLNSAISKLEKINSIFEELHEMGFKYDITIKPSNIPSDIFSVNMK